MEYGLIGGKLGHSFSRDIHEELADYTYELCPLTEEEFIPFMENRAFRAINVTIPYKQAVLPYLDEIDDSAKAIGAVNTIVNKEGRLIGHNTDFNGFLYTLQIHHIDVTGKKCIVLGDGGASKAIIAVLKYLQAKDIIIVYRKDRGAAISQERCLKEHADSEVLINTTPVGMFPNTEESPIDLSRLPKLQAVVDIIYNPLETMLMKQAQSLGIPAVAGGLEMLVAQAKYAVEFFLDKTISDDCIDPIYQKILDEKKGNR